MHSIWDATVVVFIMRRVNKHNDFNPYTSYEV